MLKIKKQYLVAISLVIFILPFSVRAGQDRLEINHQPLAFTDEVELNVSENNEDYKIPWEWKSLTPSYEYSFISDGLYDPSRPLEIKIYYQNKNNNLKQIFFFDYLSMVWRQVPTQDFPDEQYVSTRTGSTSGRLIVLEKESVLTVGDASWYKYKDGLFAASPDFAKGSVIRVFNLNNDKYVDVTINDWGPERDKHPTRVIDLDKVAFEKIAVASVGLVPVKIEALKIVTPDINRETPQITDVPSVTASSSIILVEDSGKIIWGKNENKVSSLASLTKLVAVKIFLDTNPDLSKVVSYKKQDENYNYQYCKPWEVVKLTVEEGETMTIENLLYSSLVRSYNNAIETLVRVSGLSRADFISRMNKMA